MDNTYHKVNSERYCKFHAQKLNFEFLLSYVLAIMVLHIYTGYISKYVSCKQMINWKHIMPHSRLHLDLKLLQTSLDLKLLRLMVIFRVSRIGVWLYENIHEFGSQNLLFSTEKVKYACGVERKKIMSADSILIELKTFPLIEAWSFWDLFKLCDVFKYIFKVENVTASIDLQWFKLLSHFISLVNKSPKEIIAF